MICGFASVEELSPLSTVKFWRCCREYRLLLRPVQSTQAEQLCSVQNSCLTCVGWIGCRRRSRYSRNHRQNFTVSPQEYFAVDTKTRAKLYWVIKLKMDETTVCTWLASKMGVVMALSLSPKIPSFQLSVIMHHGLFLSSMSQPKRMSTSSSMMLKLAVTLFSPMYTCAS